MWRTVAWLPHRTDLRIRSWASFPLRRRASSMPVPFRANERRRQVTSASAHAFVSRQPLLSFLLRSTTPTSSRVPFRTRVFDPVLASFDVGSNSPRLHVPLLSSPLLPFARRDATRREARCVASIRPSRRVSALHGFAPRSSWAPWWAGEPRSSRHAPVRERAWAWASGWASRAWWRRRHGRRLLRLRFPHERRERRWALPRTASWWILAGPRTPIGRSWSLVWRAEARRSDGGKRAEWRWTRHGHVVNSKVNSSGTGASETFPLLMAWKGEEGWI